MNDSHKNDGIVRVRGAREHNLQNIEVDIPRDTLVVFKGVSGSGKFSLAFGTLYAEAQRRYLESVSPYARGLFHQLTVPAVDSISGLPPAVALQQQRGADNTVVRWVGTTPSNLLRMLYSRARQLDDVLALTVDAAAEFFCEQPHSSRAQYCRKLALVIFGLASLQQNSRTARPSASSWKRSCSERIEDKLYVLDEPTTGLHPSDVDRLQQLQNLVTAGNTVVVVEHDMQIIAASDWVIDIGSGAGDEGGHIVAAGEPAVIAHSKNSKTAAFLAPLLQR